jgi:hypothetical protein
LGNPVDPQDAATKVYVDNAVQGLDAKASVRVATTANITLSGTQTIDGVAVQVGNRVLVKDQSAPAENGIYVAASGSWTRAIDADTWDELVSAYTFVEQGTVNGDNGFTCTVNAGGTLGTTAVTWVQFSGAGQIDAGAGLTKTGNQINVGTASSARIVVNADNIDLATTAITPGTYRSITIDAYGRATAGTNPTTLSGYGITDAYTQTQTDTLLNAKLSLSGGTMTGNIAMGTNKITGLGDPTSAQEAATKNYIDTLFGSTASAAASASAAALSELNAFNSAQAASGSASAASGSASSALSSANAAAASFDAFDDIYLGAKTANPTVDNDGDPLQDGALYFNTVATEMRVYGGGVWRTAASAINGTTRRQTFTATGGQTTFAVSGGYDSGFADVYLNGVKLVNGVEVDVSSGTNVVLAAGANNGDTVDVVAYGAFSVANTLPLTGGTMTGAIAFAVGQTFPGTGDVTLTGTQTLTNKTINSAILNDGYTEEVFAITDGTVNLDPNNGSIQTWTLGANRTPGQANWAAGQSITLMVDDGSAFTITWSTLAVVWTTDGGSAPTLNTSGFTTITLWKVGTTIYGARVGDA